MSSRPDWIFEIHQLWQSGFSRVYSNCYCSCLFEPEIIKIGQSSHKMYSNNIESFQESTTISNACTKKSGNLLNALRITTNSIKYQSFVYSQLNDRFFSNNLYYHNHFFAPCLNVKQLFDRTLSGAITPGYSWPGISGNEGVLSIPQSSSITGASQSNCLMSYPGHPLWGRLFLFCRDAVSVFSSHNRLIAQSARAVENTDCTSADG